MDRPPVIEREGTQTFKLGSPLSLTSCFLSRRIIKIQVMPQGIKRTMQRLSFHTSCFLFIRHSHTNKDLQKSHTHTLSHTHTPSTEHKLTCFISITHTPIHLQQHTNTHALSLSHTHARTITSSTSHTSGKMRHRQSRCERQRNDRRRSSDDKLVDHEIRKWKIFQLI